MRRTADLEAPPGASAPIRDRAAVAAAARYAAADLGLERTEAVTTRPPAESAPAAVQPESGRGPRTGLKDLLLVVDDDPSVCRIIQRAIRRHFPGLRVRAETTGADALAAIGREWPTIVLLDYYVPDVRGDVIAAYLRAHEEERGPVRLLVMSGVRPAETLGKSLEWAPELFLAKPLDPHALVKVIGDLLPGGDGQMP